MTTPTKVTGENQLKILMRAVEEQTTRSKATIEATGRAVGTSEVELKLHTYRDLPIMMMWRLTQ